MDDITMIYFAMVFVLFFLSLKCEKELNTDDSILASKKPIFIRYHEETKMNYFGCIICALITYLVNPLFCIPVLVIRIIWWLFHVGRKDDEEEEYE